MLRVLLCITCCSAPPARRQSKVINRANSENRLQDKSSERVNFKSLIALGQDVAKDITITDDELTDNNPAVKTDLLATSQLDNYEVQSANEKQDRLSKASNVLSRSLRELSQIVGVQDSFNASTSASTYAQQLNNASETVRLPELRIGTTYEQQKEQLNFGDDQSLSSNEVAPYQEDSAGGELSTNVPLEQQQQQDDQQSDAGTLEIRSRGRVNIPSTTKIGDYARLEYSPVDDLDSITTFSQSRGGSEMGAAHAKGSVSRSSSLGRQFTSSIASSANISRSSSRGIESTSISNASQLSNEQLQQNLTNILETANSPIPVLFGTIGLPLGPPLDGNVSETARTSPETTGAALTSASMDSLSDSSLRNVGRNEGDDLKIVNKSGTLDSTATPGAALVVDSTPARIDLVDYPSSDIPVLPTNAMSSQVGSSESILTKGTIDTLTERGDSPHLSILSSGLTNPTPTPSEMSGGSLKKKLKLKPKSLLKKLKPGSSKKKNKDESTK